MKTCQLPTTPNKVTESVFHRTNCQFIFLLFTFYFLIILSSCRKDAGLGGNATLTVYAEHHGNVIINHIGYPDTVFLKYNVDEFPGSKPSDYDAFFVGTPREDFVKIEGLTEDLAGDVKRLTNFTPEYRLRVGDYRVLFEVDGDKLIMYRILHRKDAYR